MKKLPTKLLILILSSTLVFGVFVAYQSTDKTKQEIGTGQVDNSQSSIDNDSQTVSIKNNNNVPDLKGGPEDLTRPLENKLSSSQVYYNSKNRTIKNVALTFDDGPDAYYTPQILDILKLYNIKATFFIVGIRAQAHPEIVQRIVKEGHSIGNHTWDHPVLTKVPIDKLQEELNKTEQELFRITGIRTAMFRPPYGSLTTQQASFISSMGYSVIDWSVDTRDWARTPVPQIMRFVSKEVYPGGIILQHCAGGKNEDLSNTIKALPQIINLLKNQGYSFVTVQDLLGIPAGKM